MSGRLTDGFRDIIDLRWSEFHAMETDPELSNFDTVITALVRACVKGNLRAIQTGLDRLDGKIAMEIEVEYPKFYTVYPNATICADESSIIDVADIESIQLPEPVKGTIEFGSTPAGPNLFKEIADEELPTGSLRAVLERMLDSSRQTVTNILGSAKAVDDGDYKLGDPLVKSVIVAGLMKLVHDGRTNAVFEIFDQLDGKIADKYKILGDDVFISNYATIAPKGAVKNDDGIYQIAADNTTNAWVAKLEEKMVENAEFEQDIDYIMHIEHEVPMLWYSKLDPIKKDIAKMVAYRCKIAVRDAERNLKYKIIADLKEHVGGILREEDIPQW